MRHFFQWVCGYIYVHLSGRQVNRFLNLCTKNGIQLWRISYDIEQGIRANLKLKDFYYLKPYLRKTKTKLKIISKKGFPFWSYRHPKLKWFLCFLLCVFCLWCYSFNFVWNIKVKGNENLSAHEIIEYLEEHNIGTGKKKRFYDCTSIEILLREAFHQLGWVSVYFDTTNLCIDVKESLYDKAEYSTNNIGKMYNLIANKDAIITMLVTRSGEALVTEGQKVRKGDVLVLGQSQILNDNGEIKEILCFKADAYVYGDVIYDFEIPLSEIEIMAIKISGKYNDNMLLHLGRNKLNFFLNKMEENGGIILDKNITTNKNKKEIYFNVTINAREQIGIHIPAEEVRENEFE